MNDSIIQTLTVPFAAGFVVQRFLEILDSLAGLADRFPDSYRTVSRTDEAGGRQRDLRGHGSLSRWHLH